MPLPKKKHHAKKSVPRKEFSQDSPRKSDAGSQSDFLAPLGSDRNNENPALIKEIKGELESKLKQTKEELRGELIRKSDYLADMIQYKINEHSLQCMTSSHIPQIVAPKNIQPENIDPNLASNIEDELLKDIQKTVAEEDLKSFPITENKGKTIKKNELEKAKIISEEYFAEDIIESNAVQSNIKLDEFLIGCLLPMQLVTPKQNFISVQDMYFLFKNQKKAMKLKVKIKKLIQTY